MGALQDGLFVILTCWQVSSITNSKIDDQGQPFEFGD
jgi:hypothetical protein